MTVRDAEGDNPAIIAPTGLEFYMFQLLVYKKKNDIKLLEQLKSGFKRFIKWNKYRSQMTIQPQNNNLNYLIDPIFTNANRFFFFVFLKK